MHRLPSKGLTDTLVSGCKAFAAAYIDDVVIYSSTWRGHIEHLRMILQCIKDANLTVKLAKCQFGMKECVCVRPEMNKIEAVESFPRLETMQDFWVLRDITVDLFWTMLR